MHKTESQTAVGMLGFGLGRRWTHAGQDRHCQIATWMAAPLGVKLVSWYTGPAAGWTRRPAAATQKYTGPGRIDALVRNGEGVLSGQDNGFGRTALGRELDSRP